MSNNSRYPYTYAADLVRSFAGYNENGSKISRSDASHIRSSIAQIIGMQDEELAKMLAGHYAENQEAIDEKTAQDFILATNTPTQNYWNP